jgi:exonuclease VII large subunit
MKRWVLVYLMLLLTGTVNAAPAMQAVAVDVPPWAAVGGGAALVAWVLVTLISRSPKNSNDVLNKLADNQADAIKLDRERFEAQKEENHARNKNVEGLIEQLSRQNERMHNADAALMRTTSDQLKVQAEEAAAKHKLAESINAMNDEDARHNKLIENRLTTIENTMGQMKADIHLVKLSVGPNAAGKLELVEKAFARLAQEFQALITTLEEAKPTLEVTEVTHEETTIVAQLSTAPADSPVLGDSGTGASPDAGADSGSHA